MMKYLLAALLLFGTGPVSAAQIRFTTFDQNHSTVGFAVPIAGGISEVDGKFTAFSADLLYDEQNITRSTLTVTIQTASINTGIPDRDADLRSPHFFDVAAYPEIRFVSSRVAKHGDDLIVSGALDMHGVRKPVDFVCHLAPLGTDPKTGKVYIGGSATATIDRRDFGITWEHPVSGFVGDRVTIAVHVISKLTPREPEPKPAGRGQSEEALLRSRGTDPQCRPTRYVDTGSETADGESRLRVLGASRPTLGTTSASRLPVVRPF